MLGLGLASKQRRKGSLGLATRVRSRGGGLELALGLEREGRNATS